MERYEPIVARVLGEEGLLSRAFPRFRPRTQQLDMAAAVSEVIGQGGALVVEAGTGVGKTFAYLVPALLGDKRVLISTATKALQEQLVERDLPRLLESLAGEFALHRRVALLKGRANYLCLHRMDAAILAEAGRELAADSETLRTVKEWSISTAHGDLAEISALHPSAALLASISSTRENCLGGKCPQFSACHVVRARRHALAADVAVVNHHLFFADQSDPDGAESQLLSQAQVVIFDEAHSLNTVARQALGVVLSTGQLKQLAHDLQQVGQSDAPGWRDWSDLALELLAARDELVGSAGGMQEGARADWSEDVPEVVHGAQWHAAWRSLTAVLQRLLAQLDALTAVSPDLDRLHQRVVATLGALMDLSVTEKAQQVRWLEWQRGELRLAQTPLQAGPSLQRLWGTGLVHATPDGEDDEGSAWDEPEKSGDPAPAGKDPRSFIFTSATLGNDDTLQRFTEPLGLQHAKVLRLGSPFDYAEQASLYIPEHLPAANDAGHAQALAHWLADVLIRMGGRSLILTTSLRARDIVGDVLRERLGAHPDIELLLQSAQSHTDIAERFQRGGTYGKGCVLVASNAYWQGFDVPGDALQMVVIDKLPFPVPTDPLVVAYSNHLETQGKNPFKDFALQEAALALRQGAGRLIRSETDSGVLVVADARLTKGYGKWLQRQLPPMRRLSGEDEFQAAIEALTRTSTTDRPSS